MSLQIASPFATCMLSLGGFVLYTSAVEVPRHDERKTLNMIPSLLPMPVRLLKEDSNSWSREIECFWIRIVKLISLSSYSEFNRKHMPIIFRLYSALISFSVTYHASIDLCGVS